MATLQGSKAPETTKPASVEVPTKDDVPAAPKDNEVPVSKDGNDDEEEEIVMSQVELEKWKMLNDEDVRMDGILLAESTMNETFDNRAYVHPHGLTQYDYPSIAKDRREGLENYKMKVRHENYHYLHQHQELDAMIQVFLKKLLAVQPVDAIKFAAEFFSKKNKETGTTIQREDLDEQTKLIERYRSAHPKVKMPTVNSLLMKRPDDLISLQSLNIEPHAYDFRFENDRKKVVTPPEPPKEKHYCGCKDPGRKTIYRPHAFVSDVSRIMRNILYGEDEGEDTNKPLVVPPSSSKGFTPSTTMSTTMDEDESVVEGSVNYEAEDEDEDE